MNIIKFDEMVTLNGNRVMTDTLTVAKHFNKRHSDVLRAVKNVDCSSEFSERNFALANYIDEQGKERPMYKMTKDGFVFLVMGFTGKLASSIKERYINAFNWMAEQLQTKQNNYFNQYNDLTLAYIKDKESASNSGRTLRKWRDKKPVYKVKFEQLEDLLQSKLPI